MKIIIYSHSPTAPSGYGQQVRMLTQRLEKQYKHDVRIIAIDYHNSPCHMDQFKVYPTKPGLVGSPESLYYWANKLKPNIILQLFDAWTLGKSWIKPEFPVICYNPVDCSPIARRHELGQEGSVAQLAMSKHALIEFEKANFINPIYLPHCYDNEIFYCGSKKLSRKELGLPEDGFYVGLIGTNITHRKNIPGQLLAFKNFNERYPETKLVLHTEPNETISTSFDIYHYLHSLELDGKVFLISPSAIRHKDIDDVKMHYFYNSIDVLMHASLGEGFGVSIIEAQACGTPVIVTNWSAMPDVAGKGCMTIHAGEKVADSGTNSWWFQPSHEALTKSLRIIYEDESLRESISFSALKNTEKYTWSKWMGTWEYVLQTHAM